MIIGSSGFFAKRSRLGSTLVAMVLVAGACSLFRPSTPDASKVQAEGMKSALITAYEERLERIVSSDLSCEATVKAIQAEQVLWLPVWRVAGATPGETFSYPCKDAGVDSGASDGGAE